MDVLRFRWNGSELVDVTGAPTIPLYVADSFLLQDGKVVGYDRHLSRFGQSAQKQGLMRPLDDFLRAVTQKLPRTGSIFPRLDLTERGELELHLRPAPALAESLTVVTASHDPRVEPGIKGPDIPSLNTLREEAIAQGAQEAIILSHDGFVVDGATTCLVWAEGNSLTTPPQEATRVSSVTVSVLKDMTSELGYSWSEQWLTPQELEGKRLYALNALHGIRAVTGWINGPDLAVDLDELDNWRTFYKSLASEVSYS